MFKRFTNATVLLILLALISTTSQAVPRVKATKPGAINQQQGKPIILAQVEKKNIRPRRPRAPAPRLFKIFFSVDRNRNAKAAFTRVKIAVNVVKRGSATHYKMAECHKFIFAKFQPYHGGSRLPQAISFSQGGDKSICVELVHRPTSGFSGSASSNKKSGTIKITKLVEHTIKDEDFLAFSKANGFRHVIVQIAGGYSGCNLDLDHGISDVASPTGECNVGLFYRGRLNHGWQFLSLSVGKDDLLSVTNLRLGSGDQPKTSYTLIRTGDNVVSRKGLFGITGSKTPAPRGGLITLQLLGPEGADWRDAFRR
jgi:hypothetical protein